MTKTLPNGKSKNYNFKANEDFAMFLNFELIHFLLKNSLRE